MKQTARKLTVFLLLLAMSLSSTALAQINSTVLFHDYVGSIAIFQDEMYILHEDGIYKQDFAAMEETLVTGEVNGGWDTDLGVDSLLSDSSGLYGYQSRTSSLIQILDENSQLVGKVTLAMPENISGNHLFFQDQSLYVVNTYDTKQAIYKVSLADGAVSEAFTKNVDTITPYKDGKALVTTSQRVNNVLTKTISMLDLHSGELTELAPTDLTVRTSAYDTQRDCFYLVDINQIYRMTAADLTPQPISPVMGGDKLVAAAFGDGMIAVVVDNCIDVRNLDTVADQTTLAVRQPYGRGYAYETYITTHPDVTLSFVGDPNVNAEEQFAEDMATQSSDVDIYLLTDKNMLSTVHAKGYGIDLSTDSQIKAIVDDMHPSFEQFFRRDEKIYALPQQLYVTMIGYSPAFFEAFDFELPATYDQMLNLAQLWLDDYAFDSSNAFFNIDESGLELIPLLERYADECTRNGKDIVYNTPEMAALLQNLLDVTSAYDAEKLERTGNPISPFRIIDVPLSSDIYGYLPLAVNPGNQAVVSGSDIELAYFVVNPYSTHKQEATDFLSCMAENWENQMKLLLLKSSAEPTESSYYLQEKAALQAKLDKLTTQLAAADPSDAASINADIQQATDSLASIEAYRWEVSQEGIDWYLQIVDRIYLSPLNPMTILEASGSDLFTQLQEHAITPPQFLKTLDERIRSIYLEDE
ncbi:MAG: hypothetical protein GX096_00855 [Clostridiales bacterium]|nr:hypothetical protein [Clostridiales bacterium]